MRLIDFNLSTADLLATSPLFWENSAKQILPIQGIRLKQHQLILIPKSPANPLTLDQFNARTRQVTGAIPLVVQTDSDVIPLFGYRLSQGQLLLG